MAVFIDIWYPKIRILEQEIYKLFVSQCKNIKELQWKSSQPLPSFPGALSCFSQLYSLGIDITVVDSNALYEMAQICKDLNELIIYRCSQDLPGLISLIDVQKNLKKISCYYDNIKKGTCKELSNALTRKGNTINYLYLNSVSIIPPSFLTSLINLKEISIYNGQKYDNSKEELKVFQQYLANSKFPDLQSLTVDGLSCFKELAMSIKKTKGNILNIKVSCNKKAKNTGMLIKAVINNCPEIKILSTHLEQKDFINIKSLLLNCKHLENIRFNNLDFVVNDENDENDNIGDELLDILTKFSPNSLTDIAISGNWKYSIDAFERFFESYRGRTLSYFEIIRDNFYRYCVNITADHKIIIRKYIKEGVIMRWPYNI